MITDGMLHGRKPTAAQQASLDKMAAWSKRWIVGEEDDSVKADTWENVAETLGDLYTGPSVGKSYPLTLEAILPTTPGPGDAARIPLADVVSPGVREYVNHPELLRIPDEELVAPRISATVQVESQDEWNKVVAHLVAAGMLEREVPSETLRYKDEAVQLAEDIALDPQYAPWQHLPEKNAHQSL